MNETTEKAVIKKKKKNHKKVVKRIIAAVVAVVVIGAIVFGLLKLFKKEDVKQTAMTGFTYRGSISKMIEGSGTVQPAESKTIAATQKGKVEHVYFAVGDNVEIGDVLYDVNPAEAQKTVDEAQKAVDAAQKTIDGLNKQMSKLYESESKLAVRAPFTGKLTGCALKKGDAVSEGQVIATLIDDSKLRLTQYFSYAYKGEISVGMKGTISVPATMSTLEATVESVTMIERISVEGGKLFEVVFIADNPGTLTAGMKADASVKSDSGEQLFSYESAALENYNEKPIVAEAGGTAITVNLKDYLRVSSGALIVQLDSDQYTDSMETLNESISAAQAALDARKTELEAAMKLFDGYSAVAPISGTIMSCTIYEGEDIVTGTSSISIANTSVMFLDAQIDGQDVMNVTQGTMVNITLYGGTEMYLTGEVTEVSLEGKNDYGISYFPAKIRIDNPDGTLKSGMYCSYSIQGSQSNDCILAPTEAVKYTEQGACLFVKGDSVEGAIELGEGIVPAGFSAVPVVTGLSDDSVVEIVSGVDENVEVFTAFMTDQANSYGPALG